MANIAIADLRSAGYDLFSDSESFLSSLSEEELDMQGGGIPITTIVSTPGCIGYEIGRRYSAAALSFVTRSAMSPMTV